MNNRLMLVLAGAAFMLSACGDDNGGTEQADTQEKTDKSSEMAATEQSADSGSDAKMSVEVPSSGEVQDSGLGYEYVVIDHSKDVPEFELRRKIASKESLIEHYEENGWDTGELEQELEELQAKLEDMVE